MSGRSSSSDEKTISLCRFDQAPILLEQVTSASKVCCSRLEDALDDPLDPTIEFPVEYPQQDDALLLQCRLPKPRTLLQETSPLKGQDDQHDSPMASITGLPEEFSGAHPQINMKIYKGRVVSEKVSSEDCRCICQAPHTQWERQTIDVLKQKQTPEPMTASVDMLWVDLRSCSLGKPSLGEVAHFCRSLFTTSHAVSPWCPSGEEISPNMPRRVAILFPNAPHNNTFNVRIGDICPSWALYSISRVQVPETWCPWNGESPTDDMAPMQSATLLIYKPLPPRPLMALSPPSRVPLDSTMLSQLPKGCLWETYFVCNNEEEGKEEVDRQEEKKQTPDSATRSAKAPHCRMVGPPYISYSEEYIQALWKPLLDNWKVIRDEALRIPQWTAWPETQHYSKATTSNSDDVDDADDPDLDSFHPTWTVFPLCYCFPASIPENKKWIDQTCAFVPKTIQLLQQHLGPVLRTALFSRLDPETTLEAHTGWADLANHVIRFHLPLVVPKGDLCGTWVDGCVETHQEGQFLCFDDSKVHRAFNYSTGERIVLILDLARPDNLPLGTATGGHTDELDKFIAQMTI